MSECVVPKTPQELYNRIKRCMDENGVGYIEIPNALTLEFDHNIGSHKTSIYVYVDRTAPILCTSSILDLQPDDSKRLDILNTLNRINNQLIYGAFVYDELGERILFRCHTSTENFIPSKDYMTGKLTFIVSIIKQYFDEISNNC
jgi:hypothetical protein